MIPKKPAPHLMRGEYRFSERIMLHEFPMPAGSFVTHFGKEIHWDGAKDEEAVLLIMGEGPAATTRVPFEEAK
jgi:hypothetical protein